MTACDACGKAELKGTVVLDIDGDIKHYGCVCAAHALGRTTKEVKDGTKAADKARADAARQAQAAHRARTEAHPLYVEAIRLRDQLTAEFGFWSRAPKSDPRANWFDLINQAKAATA